MVRRWLIVLAAAAALIAGPLLIRARPTAESNISAVDLATRVQASGGVPWSGLVRSSGALQVPDSESFATLGKLLGEDTDLRVWWRSAEDWRVDRIRSTGETDLFRSGQRLVRWVFESETATISPMSDVRLPDAFDLLPPTLARSMLQGAQPAELSRLSSRRIAGVAAPGLRLEPADSAATVDRVDLWVDPATGLALRVELFGTGDRRPVLSTTLGSLDRDTPSPATTRFRIPDGVEVRYDDATDVAAAANAFDPYDLPASLGGLASRTATDPGAVGVYGRGPTTLIALPLRGRVAGPLRERLRSSATAQESELGTLASVGPVGLLVTPAGSAGQSYSGGFLLAGTVTPATLQRAAAQLLAAA